MNSPSEVSALTVPTAAPTVSVGRMIEHTGNVRLRNGHGSGMMRLVWKFSPPNGAALRSGNTKLGLVESVNGGALPALSCQVWKCAVSVGPILSRILNTSGLVTLLASG